MSTLAFKAARDFLLNYREDYATAYAQFRWPELPQFNWALDWFDAELARGELAHRPALRITGLNAAERSFAELSEASNRVANGLRALGVARGDRILLMLGNVAPLWETMLAAMKLGAVLVPATTLLTPADLAERVARAGVRFVVLAAADAPKLADVDASVRRIAVGGAEGCVDYARLLAADPVFTPDRPTDSGEPMLLYFTSGTTARPKLVLHSHLSYPVGALSTLYWLGLQPGDFDHPQPFISRSAPPALGVSLSGFAQRYGGIVSAPQVRLAARQGEPKPIPRRPEARLTRARLRRRQAGQQFPGLGQVRGLDGRVDRGRVNWPIERRGEPRRNLRRLPGFPRRRQDQSNRLRVPLGVGSRKIQGVDPGEFAGGEILVDARDLPKPLQREVGPREV